MSHAAHHPARPCFNCGHPLKAGWEFCPECGQKNDDLDLPIGHVLEEAAEGIWHFDSKLWATVKALFTRPGQITKDFLEGRRVRYVPPIRLYVFTSFIFFLLFNMASHRQPQKKVDYFDLKPSRQKGQIGLRFKTDTANHARPTAQQAQLAAVENREKPRIWQALRQGVVLSDSASRVFEAALPAQRKRMYADSVRRQLGYPHRLSPDPAQARRWTDSLAQYLQAEDDTILLRQLTGNRSLAVSVLQFEHIPGDSATTHALLHGPASERDEIFERYHIETWYDRVALVRLFHLFEFNNGYSSVQDVFLPLLVKAVSYGMFLFMPLTALLLYAFFHRQRRYYTEHLIHALHLHTAFFLLAILLRFLPTVFGHGDLLSRPRAALLLFAALLYPLFSAKRVYGQSWGITLGKYAGVAIGYGTLFILFVIGVVFTAVLLF